MARAISNKNVYTARFKVVEFDGVWKASFGKPELRGTWIIYGGSGSGKTTFTLMLAKYLSRFARVAYDSLEQGLSLSLQRAWERVNMAEAGKNIILLDKEGLKELTDRLSRKSHPQVVIIDSLHYLFGFRMSEYAALKQKFPDVLFIYICHEKGGQPKGNMAQNIRYDSDIKIRVEGYKAFFTTRYEVPERREGGSDFVIWTQGASEYWGTFEIDLDPVTSSKQQQNG